MSTVKKASHWVPVLFALAFAAGCGSVAQPVAASGGNPASPSTDQKPAANPPSAAAPTEQSFGDIHSRWQLQVRPWSSVWFADGLMVVFEPDSSSTGSPGSLTAYRAGTGTQVWSLDSVDEPQSVDPLVIPAGLSDANGACPQSVTRVNPASGATMWTAQISDYDCGSPAVEADDTYVVVGHTVLNAATGSTLQQVPAGSADEDVIPFGNDILVDDDTSIELEAAQAGALQPKWNHAKPSSGTYWADGGYPDLWLVDTEDANPSQILNPATGAITGSFGSRDAFPTPQGITEISPSGHFLLLSASGATVTTGPKVSLYDGRDYADAISYSGGLFWQYLPPTGLTQQQGVDAVATSPGSFKNTGSLALTASQLSDYDGGGSADGLDQVESDGQYAAILAEPCIYVYKL